MAQGIQMPYLNWDYKDQQLAFSEWKDFLESYLVIINVDEAKKWHYNLLSVGTKGREFWETWQLSPNQKADSSGILKKFEEHLIGTPNNGRQSVIAKLNIQPPDVSRRVTLRFKADTGANGSIMPIRCMQQMYLNKDDRRKVIQRNRATLTAVNETAIHHHGVVKMPVQLNDSTWITSVFYVCERDGPAILSCDASEKLGKIKVKKSRNISAVTDTAAGKQIKDTDDLQRVYPDRSEGLGNMPGEYDIELKEDASPVVALPRKYRSNLETKYG
ncbi:hypothetical protein CAPTEDRAFT_197341 [Capitella teleta]|uniref:Uncharacterized protein n=1 Tax=Capitella teleta TaxID=283909 RepID=R7TW35_CAPTE|nr:hypothetical protein CAPTEDRAFT_197341 [Capitella teleta]|eukprot:ELT95666.1 hypothetical protein CAPTEDRAFT_197341 [Capitella teleta]